MKIRLSQSSLSAPYHMFLRQAGYTYIENRQSGQGSFVRPLTNGLYPRFHIYVDELEDGMLSINLHLDQKKASYEGITAHSGEYDDGAVVEEGNRLKSMISGTASSGPARKSPEPSNPWSAFKK